MGIISGIVILIIMTVIAQVFKAFAKEIKKASDNQNPNSEPEFDAEQEFDYGQEWREETPAEVFTYESLEPIWMEREAVAAKEAYANKQALIAQQAQQQLLAVESGKNKQEPSSVGSIGVNLRDAVIYQTILERKY